ncbi:MAG: hypothetical protein ACRD4R_05730 [Candidatus Acidiferrales bacterium]
MSRARILYFSLAVLATSAAVVSGGPPGGSTVIRVTDPSGAPYADAVLLVNPGQPAYSIALVTDRSGTATLPRLNCKVCVVTAMDPRRLFFDKTTEFEGGAPSVTVTLPGVRPIQDIVSEPGAIKVSVQVKGPDGMALADRAVVIRKSVGTMEDNTFGVGSTDRKGRIVLERRPGEYVLASLVNGRFLEATLNLAPAVKRKCSDEESDCYIANVVRNPLPTHLSVRLAPQTDTP